MNLPFIANHALTLLIRLSAQNTASEIAYLLHQCLVLLFLICSTTSLLLFGLLNFLLLLILFQILSMRLSFTDIVECLLLRHFAPNTELHEALLANHIKSAAKLLEHT